MADLEAPTSSGATALALPVTGLTVSQRMEQLDRLMAMGSITQSQYETKAQQILDSL